MHPRDTGADPKRNVTDGEPLTDDMNDDDLLEEDEEGEDEEEEDEDE
ncbi:MAG: hypothetical protein M3N13_08040 [Candidatus Eremiobacteraeota bacterium]|nr:hypothetical protein [Candidatus Eremiobacteraeota bacterium]